MEPITAETDRKLNMEGVDLTSDGLSRQDIFNIVTNELSDVAILEEYGIVLPNTHIVQSKNKLTLDDF